MTTALQTRNSVMAIKEETTEGTPVAPAASGDYVALQADLSVESNFEELTNEELKGSIAPSQPTKGLEEPSASFSHYFRHSGTEGTAPNYGPILKALMGEEKILTEYDTIVGSTTTVLKVDTGEGADYAKGDAVLVKNANGFEVRHVESVSGDDLTLNFALENAPGTGVNLGQSVNYKPKNENHPTLSMWHYLANKGAIELIAGTRVTAASFDFSAGQNINANYSFEGTEYFFNPIEVTATTKYVDWTDDDGTFAISVAEKMYKDPVELAEAIETAMNASATTETYTVTYNHTGSDKGKFTFATATSTLFSLLWNTGTNAANTIAGKVGFSSAADDTGATSYVSDNEQDLTSPQTASFDDTVPIQAKNALLMIGSQTDNVCISSKNVTVDVGNTKTNIESICEESGIEGSIIDQRAVTIRVLKKLNQYEVKDFENFRKNQEVRVQLTSGAKSGGNFQAGKTSSMYMSSGTISSFQLTPEDGIAYLDMTISGFANANAEGEFHISHV